ncbi:MAG: hypothetical protein GY915_03560 [bacterium]|nr:hypothetical protein [bacterium]
MTISANNPSLKNTGTKPKKSLTARQVIILRWTTIALCAVSIAGGTFVFFPAFFLVAAINLVAYRSLDKAQQKIVDDKIGVHNSRIDYGTSVGAAAGGSPPIAGSSPAAVSA